MLLRVAVKNVNGNRKSITGRTRTISWLVRSGTQGTGTAAEAASSVTEMVGHSLPHPMDAELSSNEEYKTRDARDARRGNPRTTVAVLTVGLTTHRPRACTVRRITYL